MAAKPGRKLKKEPLISGAGKPRPAKDAATPVSRLTPAASRAVVWISLALVALILFVYAPIQHHDFVAWDDPEYFSENPMVTAGLNGSGFQWALTTGHMGNWNPLTWLSYMIGVQLFGLAAGPQLLINLLFHTLSTLLLFGLLHAMTRALWRSAFVAALFALHPLHVESVAWVSERKDVLSTFLAFLALCAYVWYTRRPGTARYLTVAAAFLAALMAKPMVVTLPFLMLLMDYWPLERLKLNERSSLIQKIVEKAPLLVVAIVVSVVTLVVQRQSGAVAGLTKLSAGFRVSNAIVAYAAYIGKMLWPVSLAALYPLHPLPPVKAIGCALVLLAISVAAIRCRRGYPWILVGWFWYVITLLPVIGLVQVGSQAIADRYTYVPLIGLFVILTWGAADLTAKISIQKPLLAAAAGASILGCAALARAQVGYWENSLALWTHTVEIDPLSDTSQRLLADALAKNGKYPDALPHYEEALRIEPNNAEAHTGFGYALAGERRFDDAIRQYREALRLKPDQVDAHNDLALALTNEGKLDEAIAQYSETLRLKPYAAETHSNFGVALIRAGRTSEAESQMNEALRLQPGNADAHNNLGILFANQGRIDDAVAHFRQAVALKPDFEDARRNLTIALAQQKTAGKQQ